VALAALAAAAVLACGAGAQLSDPRQAFVLPAGEGLRAVVAGGVEDFVTYRVVDAKGAQVLGLYVGNAPQRPDAERAERERLLQRRAGWPQYVHVWVADAPAARLAEAQRLMASVTVSCPAD